MRHGSYACRLSINVLIFMNLQRFFINVRLPLAALITELSFIHRACLALYQRAIIRRPMILTLCLGGHP